MKRFLIQLLGATALAAPLAPIAPSGCATVNVGVGYEGKYATYTAGYSYDANTKKKAVNVLVMSDDKRIKPFQQ